MWTGVLLTLCASAMAQNPPPAPAPHAPPPDRTTEQQIELADRTLPFRAIVTTHRILGDNAAPEADIVTTAFLLNNVPASNRPVTFAINGGPGAGSAWLDLMAMGPWRVAMPQDGVLPPSLSPALIPNAETWLPFTDLVFIDPPGTGYSRLVGGNDAVQRRIYSTNGEIPVLAQVMRRWLELNGRFASPRFMVGESYGGIRVPRLARRLADAEGVALSGIMLASPVLDFNAWGSQWQPYPWVTRLPSMTAANHKAEVREPEVEAYASGEYITDFMRGPSDAAAVQRMAERVAALTGLSPEITKRRGGRIDWWTERREREPGRIGSAYDLTVTSIDPDPTAQFVQAPDAVTDALKAPIAAAAASLYADRLNWRPDGAPGPRYEILNGSVFGAWSYNGGQGAAESLSALHTAMAFDPALHVTVMHGLYDLVTPYYASKLILDQLPPALATRARLVAVPGGHMFYTRDASRARFRDEGQALINPQ